MQTKNSFFYTYFILKKFSSKQHPMNASEIADKTFEYFQLDKKPDRRTIYAHMNDLEIISEFYQEDLAITFVRNSNKTVYLESTITIGEAHLLCDAIATSRFIDREQSRELIDKFGVIVGKNLGSFFEPRIQFKNTDRKEYNKKLFENIDLLTKAIHEGKKVTLQYLKYDVNKNLVPSRPEKDGYKKVRPYYLIWQINKYYLMYYYDDSTAPRFMRVDKIRDVQLIEEKVEPLKNIANLSDYTRNQVYMFGGMPEFIQFRCKMYSVGQVIDFFGEDVTIKPIDDECFHVEIYTSPDSIKFWLMQYITSIDQIKPKKLAIEIQGMLEEALERNRIEVEEESI